MLVDIKKNSATILLKLMFVISIVFSAGYILLVLVLGLAVDREMPKPPQELETEGITYTHFSEGVIRYSERGFGKKAVLLLHGYNGNLEAWEKVWNLLGNCGHVVRIDIPGFGGSVWQSSNYDLNTQSRRVREFLEQRNIENVTLVGVSMGGSLSAKFAADFPEMVDGLILIAPSGYPGSLRMSGKLANILEPGTANKIAFSLAKGKLFSSLFPRSTALQALGVTASYDQNWADDLGRISASTVLVWSLGDTAVPYEYAALIAGQLRNSKIITLAEDIGHNVPENASEKIAAMVCSISSWMN